MEVILLGGPFHGELHEIEEETDIIYMEDSESDSESEDFSLHLYICRHHASCGTRVFEFKFFGDLH